MYGVPRTARDADIFRPSDERGLAYSVFMVLQAMESQRIVSAFGLICRRISGSSVLTGGTVKLLMYELI